MNTKVEWFASWFDTSYYHTLYKNRDYSEATNFIKKLSKHLQLNPTHRILDLACGKGRHAITLNKLGLNIIGIDLSQESISEASKEKNERLSFEVKDMRQPFELGEFDFILNLFTSFGYFDNHEDNIRTLSNVKQALKNEGIFVIDFMNTQKVLSNLVHNEVKTVDGITFSIKRELANNQIIKTISFNDNGTDYNYQEKVQALTHQDFLNYFKEVGLTVLDTFGDYQLNSFDALSSDRLLLIVQKN